jgi:hypothetical protein
MNQANKSNSTKNDKCYDVEYIITRRTEGKQNYYLIKWEGYPIKDCSWEPTSHLSNVMDMVHDFNTNFPHSIHQKSLKEFYIEFQKYEHKKLLQKKRLLKSRKDKKNEFNKIIISLEENEDEKTKIGSNTITLCENEENKENETASTDESSGKLSNEVEKEKNVLKLIEPIIIW